MYSEIVYGSKCFNEENIEKTLTEILIGLKNALKTGMYIKGDIGKWSSIQIEKTQQNPKNTNTMKKQQLDGFGDFVRSLKAKSQALNGAWADDREKFRKNLLKSLNEFVTYKWEKPWTPSVLLDKNGKPVTFPRSIRGREYSFMNAVNLTGKFPPVTEKCPWYATLSYIKEHGGRIKAHEIPSIVISRFLYAEERENEQGKKESVIVAAGAKMTTVYSLSQQTGLPMPEFREVVYSNGGLVEYIENVVKEMQKRKRLPRIEHDQPDSCYFVPAKDEIHLVDFKHFKKMDEYYSTLFHEIVHSTMLRLNDGKPVRPGFKERTEWSKEQRYAAEELVAEMGAFIICCEMGLYYTKQNTSAYLNSWKSMFKPKDQDGVLLEAYAQACDAAEFLLKDIDVADSIPAEVYEEKDKEQKNAVRKPVEAPKKAKKSKQEYIEVEDLYPFLAKNHPFRPTFNGVHYANGFASATDGYVLAHIKCEYSPKYEGKTIGIDGKEIVGEYVDMETFMQTQNKHRGSTIDIDHDKVINICHRAIKLQKPLDQCPIPVKIGKCFFAPELLKKVVALGKKLNINEIILSDRSNSAMMQCDNRNVLICAFVHDEHKTFIDLDNTVHYGDSLSKSKKLKELQTKIDLYKGLVKKENNPITRAKYERTIKEDLKDHKTIEELGNVSDKAALIRKAIAMQGTAPDVEKARKLAAELSKFKDSEVATAIAAINRYVEHGGSVCIDAPNLQGLYGIAGLQIDDIKKEAKKAGSVISSNALLAARFAKIKLKGMWGKLFPKAVAPFKIMFYGRPGGGKTTTSLKFANELAKMGKKVLYVSQEEGFSATLQEKLVRLNAIHPNLFISDRMPDKPADFDVIFLDSVNSLNLTPEDLRALPDKVSYVYVQQTTKDGNFRGSQEYEHDVDAVVTVNDMKATTGKNRMGMSGVEVAVL